MNKNKLFEILERLAGIIKLKELNEMAAERRDFVDNVLHEAQNLVENWCLVRYRTLTKTTDAKNHWKSELAKALNNCARVEIKRHVGDLKYRRKALEEAWSKWDLAEPESVGKRFRSKLLAEGVRVGPDETARIASDFAAEKEKLIELIAENDPDEIWKYADGLRLGFSNIKT